MRKEEKKEIRNICRKLTELLVRDTRKRVQRLQKTMEKYPERYDEEFLRDAGFSREKTEWLLAERKRRLKE